MSFVAVLAHAGEATGSWNFQLPPLHPILVNFTAALVPTSLLSDLLGRLTRKESLASAGWWMLLFAAVLTPFTALAGWLWLRQMPGMDIRPMWIHQWLGTALAVALVPFALWRGRLHVRSRPASTAYLTATAVLTAALVVQGHLGGIMSFGAGSPESDHSMTTSGSAAAPPTHKPQQPQQPTTQPGAHNWRDHIEIQE